MAPSATAANLAVRAVAFLDAVATGIMLPVGSAKCKTLECSATQFGLIGTLYGLTQMLCGPLAGKLADTRGPLVLLLVSTLGASVGYTVAGHSTTIAALFASRLLVGVVKHSSTAMNMIAAASFEAAERERDGATVQSASGGADGKAGGTGDDSMSDVQQMARVQSALGRVSSSTSLGYLVGPMASAIIPGDGTERLAWASAAIFVLASLLAVYLLPRPAAAPAAPQPNTAGRDGANATRTRAASTAGTKGKTGSNPVDPDPAVLEPRVRTAWCAGRGRDAPAANAAAESAEPKAAAHSRPLWFRAGAIGVYLLWTSTTLCMGQFWVLLSRERWDTSDAQVGIRQSTTMTARLVSNLVLVPNMAGALRAVVNVSPHAEAAAITFIPMVAVAALVGAMPLAPSEPVEFAILIAITASGACAGAGLLSWTAATMSGDAASGAHRGSGLGVLLGMTNSVEGVARFGAPVLAGMLADATSLSTLFGLLGVLGGATAAAMLVLGLASAGGGAGKAKRE